MTLQIALERIETEKSKKTGKLDLSGLGLSYWPDSLFELTHLVELDISNMIYMASPNTNVLLNRFSEIDTRISQLIELQSLVLVFTEVSDLKPLSKLTELHYLELSSTGVSDLKPLSKLTKLQYLGLSYTEVSDLKPLSKLTKLQDLAFRSTKVNELEPLCNLSKLKFLDLSNTEVCELEPLSKLSKLERLYLRQVKISELEPLSNLSQLKSLDLSYTKVRELEPLSKLPELEHLYLRQLKISDVSAVLNIPSLQTMIIVTSEETLPTVPREVLSQGYWDNCLHRLRDHFKDLVDSKHLTDIKAILLGNGQIGKTQISRRLQGQDFDSKIPSTHGINLATAEYTSVGNGVDAVLNIWDFGGQDLYHGTHALFMRTRAIFVLVWTPSSEDSVVHTVDGVTFQNQPMAYWLNYIANLTDSKSPVIILQNQCDEGVFPDALPIPEADIRSTLGGRPVSFVNYSAQDNLNYEALSHAIADGVSDLWGQSKPLMGANRHKVWKQLQQWRSEISNAKLVGEAPSNQVLTWQEWQKLCDDKKIHGADTFIEVLHYAGQVFYQPNLFNGDIILDQAWMLDAIYTVFSREECYSQIKQRNGRFTQADLNLFLWEKSGFSKDDQLHFLEMMQSCDICFIEQDSENSDVNEAVYVAPDLLPTYAEVSKSPSFSGWRFLDEVTSVQATFCYGFLSPAVSRAVIASIGRHAKDLATYWKYGVLFYTNDDTAAHIEQKLSADSRGEICITTKGNNAKSLLAICLDIITEVNKQLRVRFHVDNQNLEPADLIYDDKRIDTEEPAQKAMYVKPPVIDIEDMLVRYTPDRKYGWNGLYILGCFEKRITFYQQQCRALELSKLLENYYGSDFPEMKIAILGGGISGATAGVAASVAGCRDVTVFESAQAILSIQEPATHRFIHPHIFDWPVSDAAQTDAGLPLMNWQADNAGNICQRLRKEFETIGSSINCKTGHVVKEITRNGQSKDLGGEVNGQDEYFGSFDVVILAPGFGLEMSSATVDNRSYWQQDGIEGPFTEFDKGRPKKILISGTGDGGLIDFARATLRTASNSAVFYHHEAVDLLTSSNLKPLADKMACVSSTDTVLNYQQKYQEIFDELVAQRVIDEEELRQKLRSLKRADTDVTLNYTTHSRYDPNTSALLNRMLAFLILRFNLAKGIKAKIDEVERLPNNKYRYRKSGKTEFGSTEFDQIITRYGPEVNFFENHIELDPPIPDLRKEMAVFGRFSPKPLADDIRDFYLEKLK